MYVDVDQGDFTPVEFQGCNNTIKCLWLCEDDENEIQVCRIIVDLNTFNQKYEICFTLTLIMP